MKSLATIAVAAASLTALGCDSRDAAAGTRAPVVYGADDRTEVYAHPSATFRALAETAVAIQMDRGWLDETDPADVRVTYTRTLGEAHMLCAGEPFADQVNPGTCSGTLIDDRHVLTAGHCMDQPEDCGGAKVWVFGFRFASAGMLAQLTSDDVYGCSRVLGYLNGLVVDHAVVELDRPVVGHTPAPLRALAGALPDATPVTMIGHPNGIAMKIDSGGTVTWSSPTGEFLRATVDSFAGSSGSGVFDADGNLVALLHGGATDYVASGSCNVVSVIDPPPTAGGENLTYLRPALTALCATPGVTASACSELPDAGPPAPDAGRPDVDADAPGLDAGGPVGGAGDAGGCSVARSTGTAASATASTSVGSLFLLGAWCMRRARRRFRAQAADRS